MIKILKLFFSDLKSIIRNPVAIVIIIGLCLIPSLYAWVNIKACWDPYANTGNMPVAIVNNDEGAVFNDKQIDLGSKIVESLKKNSDVGWRFVDEWQGNYGLNEGKYYAMIIIPSDFSKDLTTMITATPIKPNIIYKVNEKANAVATELTNVAENQLTNKIKSDFVNIVNRSVFTVLNEAGKNLESNKSIIMQVKDSLGVANNNLTQIQDYIVKANNGALGLQNYLNNVQTNLPKITNEINSMQQVVNSSKKLMLSTKQTLNSMYNTINSDMIVLHNEEQKFQSLLSEVKNLNNTTEMKNLNKTISNLDNDIDNITKTNESILKILKYINITSYNAKINKLILSIEKLQYLITNEKQQLQKLKSITEGGKENLNLIIDNISLTSNEISDEINNIFSTYYSEGMNLLNGISNGLSTSMNNADSLLESIKLIVPQLNDLTSYGISSSKFATTQSNNLNSKLSQFKNKIDELNEKTKNVNENNIDKIINFMEKNPEQVASFLASPIKIKEVQLYDATIFGMGLVPFYSVLSMWVGVLLMSAFLKINCDDFQLRDGEKITPLQNHFGKMITFLLLSLIQCFIVVLGDVYILGAKPQNMQLLMFFTFYTSLTFTIIVFTLASLFGNLGKALAIVIMVFQIAGAGGIYPIQTNPKIFQILQPFWPFTYAIDGFREAIAGPTWPDVYKDIKILFLFGLIFFILGIFKKPCYKLTEHIDGSFKASGL
ncbi:YhgE/Pip domain-containing protein [Clostridium tarantellae]|uniref:YhgE/Pip domain-containing protein n=1 Tax=Clostridium tarantellae TaxID=39493 RepID=A0A6I1MKE1_9CLOT|nr:YhgE/Pip domain-containing protein [Clostridium tarantellae]MPQ43434.1 YhgE/Pip domain-containing protein [Clostridium tarantellae]